MMNLDRIQSYFPLFLQLCRFGIVGLGAAIVHIGMVMWLVQLHHLTPLFANIFAFGISFQLSYWGHRLWTFDNTAAMHRVAIPRLLGLQLLNFAANESLFYFFLSLQIPYPFALMIVLAILPLFTFAVSKFWVFGA
jgi:putative flippase GtrA